MGKGILAGHRLKFLVHPYITFGQIASIYYFGTFLIIIPLISLIENTLMTLNHPTHNPLSSPSLTLSSHSKAVPINRGTNRIIKRFNLVKLFLTSKWNSFQTFLDRFKFIRGFKKGVHETNMPAKMVSFNDHILIRGFRVIGGLCCFLLLLQISGRADPDIFWNLRVIKWISLVFIIYLTGYLLIGLTITLYKISSGTWITRNSPF